ncbi:MAG: hypothetical protein MPJ22_02060 [Pirellulales bacterium]|nr:hypothetical protein [Pirellulales bacterium]
MNALVDIWTIHSKRKQQFKRDGISLQYACQFLHNIHSFGMAKHDGGQVSHLYLPLSFTPKSDQHIHLLFDLCIHSFIKVQGEECFGFLDFSHSLCRKEWSKSISNEV